MTKPITSTSGGFRFVRPPYGGIEWRVFDAETGAPLGTVKPNGSRIRERSWDYRTLTGKEGRAFSRGSAAQALSREEA